VKDLMKKWLELKEKENTIKQSREEVELEMYTRVQDNMKEDKQSTFVADEYKLTIRPNFSVKVDQEKAPEYAQYFKNKYEITYSQYKALTNEEKHYVDEMITINSIKPTFKVEIK
jgi:hypothetical protein